MCWASKPRDGRPIVRTQGLYDHYTGARLAPDHILIRLTPQEQEYLVNTLYSEVARLAFQEAACVIGIVVGAWPG